MKKGIYFTVLMSSFLIGAKLVLACSDPPCDPPPAPERVHNYSILKVNVCNVGSHQSKIQNY